MAFTPTDEQRAIIYGDLQPQCVIACAGSGKTATAVRRMLEIRKQRASDRGFIALLSYSNVAVDTFRQEYAALASATPGISTRVLIATVDSFISTNILLPHASRVMGCSRQPFLVHGSEAFLGNFKVFNGNHGVGIEHLRVSLDENFSLSYSETSIEGQVKEVKSADAEKAIHKLGKTGAYTHDLARYWALRTLAQQERLVEILARRYPFLLVDEGQDVGTMHGVLIDLMREAGSTVSLIGDPNQAIFEFAGADGSFLRNYRQVQGAKELLLSENRRSVGHIVAVANGIAGTESKAIRGNPERKHGAFFLAYNKNNLDKLVETFASILKANGYSETEAAILCRGNALLKQLSGGGDSAGLGATEKFALAAIHRDTHGDIAAAFEFAVEGVLRLLTDPPSTTRRDILSASADPTAKALRRLVWEFLKFPEKGLPSSGLSAKERWHPMLKGRVLALLEAIEKSTTLGRLKSWANNLTVRKLGDAPLCQVELVNEDSSLIRARTVHQVKGEGIGAVLYVAKKSDLDNLLAGPSTEEGRIGYVAITRARDLLIIGIPGDTPQPIVESLKQNGFRSWGDA